MSFDFFSLSPDEEDTEITVSSKEGTHNTAWLCVVLRQLLAHRCMMYASSRSCSIAKLTRPVYRQVRSSTSVTPASHKTRTAEVTICIISERLPDRARQLPHASVWGRAGGVARGAGGISLIHCSFRRSVESADDCHPVRLKAQRFTSTTPTSRRSQQGDSC